MARPLRIELAGALCHVTACGNERWAIFLWVADDVAGRSSLMSCKDRDRALAEAYGTGMYSMEAIAEHCGVSRMTVSRA